MTRQDDEQEETQEEVKQEPTLFLLCAILAQGKGVVSFLLKAHMIPKPLHDGKSVNKLSSAGSLAGTRVAVHICGLDTKSCWIRASERAQHGATCQRANESKTFASAGVVGRSSVYGASMTRRLCKKRQRRACCPSKERRTYGGRSRACMEE